MSSLDTIVNVSISTQTTTPTQKGFGVPLIAGFHSHFTDRVRFYTSLLAMIADGFVTTDAIYKAALAVFAQNPRPPKIAIGRFTVASVMTLNLTPVVKNLHLYTVTLNGTAFTYTSDGSATAAEIVDGLVTAIGLGSVPVTATNVANVLHIIANVAGTLFDCAQDYADFARVDVTADTSGIAAQLAAITVVDDTWYALVLVPQGKLEIEAAAGYIETVTKIGVYVSGDSDILDPNANTDVASQLKALSYKRCALIFSREPYQYANGAWAGEELPHAPGSSTWKFKTLAGVAVDGFTATETTAMTTKRANYYQAVAGVNITAEGVVSSGEFIDVTIFVDWLKATIQTGIFSVLANVKKIGFTDKGIQLLGGQIKAALEAGVVVGGLVDGTQQVILPAASDVSSSDRANRILEPVTFQARLAGAVHSTVISGTLTV